MAKYTKIENGKREWTKEGFEFCSRYNKYHSDFYGLETNDRIKRCQSLRVEQKELLEELGFEQSTLYPHIWSIGEISSGSNLVGKVEFVDTIDLWYVRNVYATINCSDLRFLLDKIRFLWQQTSSEETLLFG